MTVTYEGATEQAREILHHHAVLRRGLERRAGTVCDAVENGVPYEQPLARLREYLEGEILLHAKAEERTLYRAAVTQARGSDLVRVLTAEHYALACLAAASAARGRPHGRHHRGMDHDTVRLPGQGKRSSATRAHRFRHRPRGPARGHAPRARRGAGLTGEPGSRHPSPGGAHDVPRPVYEATGGLDGQVSIEVDPRIARHQAHRRRGPGVVVAGNWPSLFVKVPAARQGLPAISAPCRRDQHQPHPDLLAG